MQPMNCHRTIHLLARQVRCHLLAISWLLLSPMIYLLVPVSVKADTTMEIVVPAYFYPSAGSDWDDLNTAATQVPITAIMNPGNGPGNSQDNNYVSAVNDLRNVGGKVIGYVHSSYGSRPINDVLNDIDDYAQWYNIDGIFIDEMANTSVPTTLDYYEDIYQHVKSVNSNWELMGNPGINTQEVYLTRPVADRLMVFESQGVNYPGHLPSAWNFNYDPSSFVNLVHTESSSSEMESHIDTAVTRNVAGIYITDDVLGNPWDRLPTYWQQEVDKVAAINNFERTPLETLGNPVTSGTITIDAFRDDWNSVTAYAVDIDSNVPGPELDFSLLQLANDNDNLFVRYQLDDSQTGTPPTLSTLHNLYLDVDSDRETGYLGSLSEFSVGADYLLQGRILYSFGGATPNDATWNPVAALSKNDSPSTDAEIAIPLSQIGSPESLDLFFQAANSNIEDLYPNLATTGIEGEFVRYLVEMTTPIAGDYNSDGTVDTGDYTFWRDHFGTTNEAADGNENGIVDAADYSFWLLNLGSSDSSTSSGQAIPEPNTMLLFVVVLLSVVCRRTRRTSICS